MTPPLTIANVLTRLHDERGLVGHDKCAIVAPPYHHSPYPNGNKLFLGVASLAEHMTSEGWQLQQGLAQAGYLVCGRNLPVDHTLVPHLLGNYQPSTVVIHDKREWDQKTQSSLHDDKAGFQAVDVLRQRRTIFKATILKDAHHLGTYYHNFATEIGLHAWIVYYHPTIVHYLAPYTRPQHLIRTYHCLDRDEVPAFLSVAERRGCLLSGAVSRRHYPLRYRLRQEQDKLPDCTVLPHPGYSCNGTATPSYLRALNQFKTAICTSSIYGYALRKIMEASACGCRVLTDLPVDDVLPEIDSNLTRIHPDTSTAEIADILNHLNQSYNEEQQMLIAEKAKSYYDYRRVSRQLSYDLEQLQHTYYSPNLTTT